MLVFICLCVNTNALNIKYDENEDDTSAESNYYAVIVGIEEFKGYPTPEEQYLDESATAIYNRLVESPNWEAENILLLLNENATKEAIHEAITVWLAEKENEDDIVVFYVASHGWKTRLEDRIHGNAYFFSYDATTYVFDETKIAGKELDSWLSTLDSKHVVVMLENCYSGRFLELRKIGRTIISAGGRYLTCPCNWSDYLQDTMFGYYLREALTGVADINNDGWVTAEEAFNYLRVPVIWHSIWYHFPYVYKTKNGGIRPLLPQVPFMYDRHSSDIPLVKL